MYDLYCEFDLEQHKQNYVNYLEVVVEPNGHICYAIPSHQKFLERYGSVQRNMTVEEFADTCPRDMWCDYLTWLLEQTGCVSVWTIGYMRSPQALTQDQQKVLDSFVAEGLMENKCLNIRDVQ